MSLVTLVSGGLDSTLMSVLANDEGLRQHPLFIDYGHLSASVEWETCRKVLKNHGIAEPVRMDLSGFGSLVPSGLTRASLRVNEDAFLPGRNLLFLLAASAYGYHLGAKAVAIGLLSEATHIFPDQTTSFLAEAERLIRTTCGISMTVVAPLISLSKRDVLSLARRRGIAGTYSCHAGTQDPCGRCVSCLEITNSLG